MEQSIKKKVDEFFAKYPYRTYPKNKILIFSNENPEYVYYITSGKVNQYSVTKQGNEVIVNIFKPPAFFPISHVVNKVSSQYIYETASEVEARMAPVSDVLNFIKGNSDVMLDLIRRLYIGMDGVVGRTMNLMSSSARNRLMYELILEGERFGRLDDHGSSIISTSEIELAKKTGLSRETINREISKLKKEGLVKTRYKEIQIIDLVSFKNSYHTG